MASAGRYALRAGALGYVGLLLLVPFGAVFYRAFEHGFLAAWHSVTTQSAAHALWLTVLITLVAVPLNTVFGVVLALLIVRRRFPGKGIVNAVVDLPLALSPVVIGVALVLVYGKFGWLGSFLQGSVHVTVIYAVPGMVIATIFVSLPFVVREVVPLLREIGTEQEEAASTLGASSWQTFRRITLPAIRWGVAYGVVLTAARCLGEFGAVAIVSSRFVGKTETMTLHVEERYENFALVDAYSAALVLCLLAVAIVLAMNLFKPKEAYA